MVWQETLSTPFEPHTEADPAALLIQLIVAFGNVVGRSAYYGVEADRHYTNLNAIAVGETAKGRKGVSWNHCRRCYESDMDWTKNRVQDGLSSGEGVIWAVRDPIPKDKDPGVSDKRLLVVESEFASTLKVMKREGNTLSPVIRRAWG